MKHGVKLYEEDRLMFAGFDEHDRYIRRAYVLHGQAKAIRLIRERHEAHKLLNKARYHR